MRLPILTAALVAVFSFAHAEEHQSCEIEDGFNVCHMSPPLQCESISKYPSAQAFAEAVGGKLTAYQPIGPGTFLARVSIFEDEALLANFVFQVQMGQVCLMLTATPLEEPAGMRL